MPLTPRSAALSVLIVGSLFVGQAADAGDDSPKLTAEQQDKLSKIQAAFSPGGKQFGNGYPIEKAKDFCGAAIPIEIHPSTVANDDPKLTWARSEIGGICQAVAESVLFTCGDKQSDDPVVKEMMRTNVKRIVCKSTKNASEVDQFNYQKHALDKGTLTFTYLASMSPGNIIENGEVLPQERAQRERLVARRTGDETQHVRAAREELEDAVAQREVRYLEPLGIDRRQARRALRTAHRRRSHVEV